VCRRSRPRSPFTRWPERAVTLGVLAPRTVLLIPTISRRSAKRALGDQPPSSARVRVRRVLDVAMVEQLRERPVARRRSRFDQNREPSLSRLGSRLWQGLRHPILRRQHELDDRQTSPWRQWSSRRRRAPRYGALHPHVGSSHRARATLLAVRVHDLRRRRLLARAAPTGPVVLGCCCLVALAPRRGPRILPHRGRSETLDT
jgi:hypothetical protein